MIIETIIMALMYPFIASWRLMPDIPDMPEPIITGGEWIITQFAQIKSILYMLLGQEFVIAMITVLLVTINFKWIYDLVMWTIRKIPLAAMRN